MKPLILTDLDGTLLNFTAAFEDWLTSKDIPFHPNKLGDHYCISGMFDHKVDEKQLVSEFFESDYGGNCQALDNTIQHVRELYDLGFDFIGITACSDDEALIELRQKNLLSVFGFCIPVYATGFHGSKERILNSYSSSIWVEDHIDNAIAGNDAGHTVFLINHPYNQEDGPYTRVKDWEEIKEILCAGI